MINTELVAFRVGRDYEATPVGLAMIVYIGRSDASGFQQHHVAEPAYPADSDANWLLIKSSQLAISYRVPDVNPTVVAALIGAVAVAVTAISGYIASVRVTRITSVNASNTVQAALMEQQRQRVWERRAEVYVDIVEYVHRRLRARQSRHEPTVLTAEGGTGIVPPIDLRVSRVVCLRCSPASVRVRLRT